MLPDWWGVRPVLFTIGNYNIDSYQFFMTMAIVTGVLIYKNELKKERIRNINALYIVIFAIFFGAIGAKLPLIFIYWKEIKTNPVLLLLSGRTIIGGLIGGFIGTVFAKRVFHIKEKLGNQIAIPVAIGMAIGRVGCFFRGCCYGKPTDLIFGIDLGDHIKRYPTQIFEILFDLLLAATLIYIKKTKKPEAGELFRIFLTSYLIFRFCLEFIRVEKISFLFFTNFQIICIVSIIFINRMIISKILKNNQGEENVK